jgi:hypothetical protein
MRSLLFIALLPTIASAAVPSQGVELRVRRGLFTETNIGVVMTFGGRERYSNAQSYLQLGIGYDLGEHVELAAQVGLGSSAANCFASLQPGQCPLADSFTMAFANLTGTYLIRLAERFYLTPKLSAGYTSLDPAPVLSKDGRPISSAANFGGGLGVEYATQMDHFSVGLDVLGRYIVAASITSFALLPRLKYTF